MKTSLQNLFLSTGLLLAGISIAQPSLTATGINPAVGDNIKYIQAGYASQGNAGANQTWDLSTMTVTATYTYTGVTPGSTANGSSFPNANVAINAGNSTVAYYKTSSSAWQNYGDYAGSIVISYSNPEDILHFPFTYNDTYTDTWAGTFTNTYTFYRTGNTTVTADGYGTVTTPAGTFSNVLRVHVVQTYQDSANISGIGPYLIYYQNDEYMWYLNGNHVPIATVESFTSGGSTSNTGSYLPSVIAGIKNAHDFISSCNTFPNPASNQVNINFTLTENKKVDVKLFNALGAQINTGIHADGLQGANNYKLDVSTLPEGIYFAQINLDGTLASTQRFIISK